MINDHIPRAEFTGWMQRLDQRIGEVRGDIKEVRDAQDEQGNRITVLETEQAVSEKSATKRATVVSILIGLAGLLGGWVTSAFTTRTP